MLFFSFVLLFCSVLPWNVRIFINIFQTKLCVLVMHASVCVSSAHARTHAHMQFIYDGMMYTFEWQHKAKRLTYQEQIMLNAMAEAKKRDGNNFFVSDKPLTCLTDPYRWNHIVLLLRNKNRHMFLLYANEVRWMTSHLTCHAVWICR